jgi:hypothetical protein
MGLGRPEFFEIALMTIPVVPLSGHESVYCCGALRR